MFKALHIEWLKIRHYRTFWVLSILFIVAVLGINYISFEVKNSISHGRGDVLLGSPFSFPKVWQTITYLSSYVLFIPGLFIITLITNEYSYKTHRQNIIDGWSRATFIKTKLALVFIVASGVTCIVFLNVLLFGLSAGSGISFENIKYLFYFFIQALSYGSVALIIGLLIKRSGLSIAIFFLYSLILENVLKAILNKYGGSSGNYLPLKTTDALIPMPFIGDIFPYQPNITTALIMSGIYLILYYLLANWKFKTADL